MALMKWATHTSHVLHWEGQQVAGESNPEPNIENLLLRIGGPTAVVLPGMTQLD